MDLKNLFPELNKYLFYLENIVEFPENREKNFQLFCRAYVHVSGFYFYLLSRILLSKDELNTFQFDSKTLAFEKQDFNIPERRGFIIFAFFQRPCFLYFL